jgi:hypothetical protein
MKQCQHAALDISILLVAALIGCNSEVETKMSSNDDAVPAVFEGSEDELSHRWREESTRYVTKVNAYVARGEKEGWDKVGEEEDLRETREPLALAVLNVVRRANETGSLNNLRERFPPAYEPFGPMLEENGQSLPVVLLLDDGRIVTRIGAPYEAGKVIVINDLNIEPMPDVITVGRSPQRAYFAFARNGGVEVRQGWDGLEGVPEGFKAKPIVGTPIVTSLIPFDTGDSALLASPEGIFVLRNKGAIRLLPTSVEMREHFEYLQKEHPKDELFYGLSMEHGAISPDGKLIAAGHQSSLHYVFDANSFEIIGEIGHLSEYPHYAVFSNDGGLIAFNSCHFYHGATVGVPTSLLPGLKTEAYELDDRLVKLQDGARIYAAVVRNDEFIIGDANGYLKAFDFQGKPRWQHFIGSSVGDIDVSRDGKRIVATTYAGFLSIIDADTDMADPFAIGTSTHHERRRWLFWKKEPKPLVW